MKKKILLTIFGLLWGGAACFAQSVLNIHQKDGTVVSYGFSEKPVVTYTEAGVHLSTAKVEVDYPFASLEKFTFTDGAADGIEQLSAVGTSDDIRVYDMRGVLLRTIKQSEGTAAFSTHDLPRGIYIIKNGKTTYKITKR